VWTNSTDQVQRRATGARRTNVATIKSRLIRARAEETETHNANQLDVYKVAKKSMRLGTVEAPDRSAAIEKAAQEFKAEAWCLYAVPRR
jgi:hypothetical protein